VSAGFAAITTNEQPSIIGTVVGPPNGNATTHRPRFGGAFSCGTELSLDSTIASDRLPLNRR
jgi:hypothetical protein